MKTKNQNYHNWQRCAPSLNIPHLSHRTNFSENLRTGLEGFSPHKDDEKNYENISTRKDKKSIRSNFKNYLHGISVKVKQLTGNQEKRKQKPKCHFVGGRGKAWSFKVVKRSENPITCLCRAATWLSHRLHSWY